MALLKLEPFPNVPTTGTAVLDTQRVLGNTVEQIILKLGGTTFTKSLITKLRVRLNQKVIWEVSGSDLDKMQLYNAHPASANYLSIMFTEPRGRTVLSQLAGAIDTSFGISSFVIEVDIAGATAPTLEAWAIVSAPQARLGAEFAAIAPLIRAMLPTQIVISSAVTDLAYAVNAGSGAGALLKRLYLHHANLTNFRVKRDGVEIFESVAPALNSFYQDEYGHDPQSGLYVADFIHDDNLSNALPTLRPNGGVATHQFLFTTSASDTIRGISDVLAPLQLL